MKSGIYLIRSKINGKKYVGASKNLEHRKKSHFYDLKGNHHGNRHLQSHYNKHGNEFEFSVLKYCHKDYLTWWEQYFIDTLKPEFNICKIAGEGLIGDKRGLKAGEESKRALLTNAQVIEIKEQINNFIPVKELSERYNVSHLVIQNIKSGLTWRCIGPEITNKPRSRPRLKKYEVIGIVKMLECGLRQPKIAGFYNIDQSTVSTINTRACWGGIINKYSKNEISL